MFETSELKLTLDETWKPVADSAPPKTFRLENAARITLHSQRETVVQVDFSVIFHGNVSTLEVFQGEIELLSISDESQQGKPIACRLFFAAAIGYNPLDFYLGTDADFAADPAPDAAETKLAEVSFEGFRILSS